MSVQIRIDADAVREVERKLGQFANRAPGAISNALNRTVTNIASNLTKEVRARYHIKAGDVNSTIKKTKASKSNLSAEVRSKGHTIPLDKFKVSPKTVNPKRKNQLKIAVEKNGIKQVMGAFVANLNGPKVVKRDGKHRLPISRLFGPSVPQMAGNQQIVDSINEKAGITYNTRLNHEVNRILQRLGAS